MGLYFFGSLFFLIFTALLGGQFFRVDLGATGVHILDLLIPFFCISLVFYHLRKTHNFFFITSHSLFTPVLSFVMILTISLFWNAQYLSWYEFFESGFYLFRITFLFLFFLLLPSLFSSFQKWIFLGVLLLGGGLFFFGILQLHFFPNFSDMQREGWDPHISRMLSTWFDPNFLGGFFAFILSLLGGLWSYTKEYKYKIMIAGIGGIFLIALLLTLSRSALLFFLLSFLILGILQLRREMFVAVFGFLLFFPFLPSVSDRFVSGFHSAISVLDEDTIFLPDLTARYRLENAQEGLLLFQEYPVLGVGYNTLRLHRDEKIHSSGGFDFSLLTIATTSGIFGVLAFLWFWFSFLYHAFENWRNIKNPPMLRGISLGLFSATVGVWGQSFFINILLFPFFMIPFFLVGSLIYPSCKTR